MSVPDDSGSLVVGGGGRFGGLQLQDGNGGNTIFAGVDDPTDEARIFRRRYCAGSPESRPGSTQRASERWEMPEVVARLPRVHGDVGRQVAQRLLAALDRVVLLHRLVA
jgi:hypothetical protein